MRAAIAGARSPCPIAGQVAQQPPTALHTGTLLPADAHRCGCAGIITASRRFKALTGDQAGRVFKPSPSEQSALPRRCQSLSVTQIVMFDAPTDGDGNVGGDCNFRRSSAARGPGEIPGRLEIRKHRSRKSTAGRMGRLVSALPGRPLLRWCGHHQRRYRRPAGQGPGLRRRLRTRPGADHRPAGHRPPRLVRAAHGERDHAALTRRAQGRRRCLHQAERVPLVHGQRPAHQLSPGARGHTAAAHVPRAGPGVRRTGLEDDPVLGRDRHCRPRHPARRATSHGPAGPLPASPWRPAPRTCP